MIGFFILTFLFSVKAASYGYDWNCPANVVTNSGVTELSAGSTFQIDVTSDSCNIGYASSYLYNEVSGYTLTYCYYEEVDDQYTSSCEVPTGTNINGNYTLYTYWYSSDWSSSGYEYTEDNFIVVDGTEPDLNTPYVLNSLLTPISESVNVSSSVSTSWEPVSTLTGYLNILEVGSGVNYIYAYMYDQRGNWICGNYLSLDAGNEFDGVWMTECDIYPSTYLVNGNGTIYYFGYDKGYNYFNGYVYGAVEITGGLDPDFNPPVIEDFTLSSDTLSLGQSLNISLTVSDDESGVNYAYCYYYNQETYWSDYPSLTSSSSDGVRYIYTASIPMTTTGYYYLYCYVYDKQWNIAYSEPVYFSVYEGSPTHAPTNSPTFVPTSKPSVSVAITIPGANSTSITVTVTMEVKINSLDISTGRRLLTNSSDMLSCSQGLSFVLSETLQHYASAEVSSVTQSGSSEPKMFLNSTIQLMSFKMNITSFEATAEQLYAKFEESIANLDQAQLDQISQFIGAYSAARNCTALSSVSIANPQVLDTYTAYVESTPTALSTTCEPSSDPDDANLSIGAVVGIAFAVAFASVCLFSFFIYWYVERYPKNFFTKKIIEENGLHMMSTQANPLAENQ